MLNLQLQPLPVQHPVLQQDEAVAYWQDPIVEEIHEIRAALMHTAGGDLVQAMKNAHDASALLLQRRTKGHPL